MYLRYIKKSFFILLGMFCLLFMVSCKNLDKKEVKAGIPENNELIIYTSMQKNKFKHLVEAFNQKYPEIEVKYRYGGSGELITRILSEAQIGHMDADLIILSCPEDMNILKDKGLLSKGPCIRNFKIDDKYKDPEFFYTGIFRMNFGLAYNVSRLAPFNIPSDFNDLREEKWSNQLALTDPEVSGTTRYFVSALITDERYGIDFFKDLSLNNTEMLSGSIATHTRLSEGDYRIIFSVDYMIDDLKRQGKPVEFIENPNLIIPIYSPAAFIKDSVNRKNAEDFLGYILSKEGQQILAAEHVLPLRDDIELDSDIKKRLDISGLSFDDEKISAEYENAVRDFDDVFRMKK